MKYLLIPFFIILMGSSPIVAQSDLDLSKQKNRNWDVEAQKNLESYLSSRSILPMQLTAEQWEKMRWLSKAMLILRGGQGLSSTDDLNDYLDKSKSEIADILINDPRFFETLVRFNFFYFGLTAGNIFVETYDSQGLAYLTLDYPIKAFVPALHSAIQGALGGNYLSFLEGDQKFLVHGSREPEALDVENDNYITGDRALEIIKADEEERMNAIAALLNNSGDTIYLNDFCQLRDDFPSQLHRIGLPFSVFHFVKIEERLFNVCEPRPIFLPAQTVPVYIEKTELLESLQTYRQEVQQIIDYAELRRPVKIEKDISKIDIVEIGDFFTGEKVSYFQSLSQFIGNSSTNRNRKRAAYILDRFLCDNLIPIDVELPENHEGDIHAGDPSCYSCHYRLDPMAGFFKDLGAGFNDYSQSEEIFFDDLVLMNRADYQQGWRNPTGSVREWNIGIIRSENDETKNYYGENLEDLFNSLKQMPEVKSCLTRRVFEYTTNVGQNVHGKYLKEATEEFTALATQNSSGAIKHLFKKFVLNNSFIQPDPVLGECYDFPNGYNPNNAPPCEVQYLFEKNCKDCHMPFGGDGGLDLTTWQEFSDGFSFVHAPQGVQLSREESLTRILNALTSTDPNTRMPRRISMDPAEREKLYLWVNQQLYGE